MVYSNPVSPTNFAEETNSRGLFVGKIPKRKRGRRHELTVRGTVIRKIPERKRSGTLCNSVPDSESSQVHENVCEKIPASMRLELIATRQLAALSPRL